MLMGSEKPETKEKAQEKYFITFSVLFYPDWKNPINEFRRIPWVSEGRPFYRPLYPVRMEITHRYTSVCNL